MTSSDQGKLTADGRAIQAYFEENAEPWRARYSQNSFEAHTYQQCARHALGWIAALSAGAGPDRRLLEIGSGAGIQAAAAAAGGWRVTGTDFAREMLRTAARQPGPRWVGAAAESLPFRGGQFDVILLLGLLGYLADPERVLSDLCGYLRPGGHLIASWASSYTDHHILLNDVSRVISAVPDFLYSAIKSRLTGRPVGGATEDPGFYVRHNRNWDEREFCTMLQRAGYRVVAVRAVNFGVLRFMGRAPWREGMDLAITRMIERTVNRGPLAFLRNYARAHVVLATPQA